MPITNSDDVAAIVFFSSEGTQFDLVCALNSQNREIYSRGWHPLFEYGVDPDDSNNVAMLAAKTRTANPAITIYNRAGRDFVPQDYRAAAATLRGVAESTFMEPFPLMYLSDYFYQQTATAIRADPENAQSGVIYLQRAATTQPNAPGPLVNYTGTGVDGWGDPGADLDGWSRPSVTLIPDSGEVLWIAFANVGLNQVGNLAMSPWVVSGAFSGETIQYSSDAIAWHATEQSNDIWFRMRTGLGDWGPPIPLNTQARIDASIVGHIAWSTIASVSGGARFGVLPNLDLDNVRELRFIYSEYDTPARFAAGHLRTVMTPWTDASSIVVRSIDDHTPSTLYDFYTSQVLLSGTYGSRWLIGSGGAVPSTGSSPVDMHLNVTFRRSAASGRVVTSIDFPRVSNQTPGILTLRHR